MVVCFALGVIAGVVLMQLRYRDALENTKWHWWNAGIIFGREQEREARKRRVAELEREVA